MKHNAGIADSPEAHGRLPILTGICRIWLCITGFIVMASFPCHMPKPGLDESWMWGLNQALAQGLTFGQDVVFNVGPYLTLFSQRYHPGIDRLAIVSHLYLGICYALALFLATRKVNLLWVFVLSITIPAVMSERNVLLAFYPLVLAIGLAKSLRETDSPTQWKNFLLCFLFSALGLLPLIKGSFLLISTVTVFLSTFLLWYSGRRWMSCLMVFLPVVSSIGFWRLAGQRLNGLPDYLTTMASVVSGYTEAMAVSGNSAEIYAFILASLVILLAVFSAPLPRVFRLFLAAVFALFLFVMFKNGFVRHDKHALIAGSAAIAGAIATGLFVYGRPIVLGLTSLVSLLAMIVIYQNHIGSMESDIVANFKTTYSEAYAGLALRTAAPDNLLTAYEKARASIRAEQPLPKLNGTTDIYSYGQSYLLASDNIWSPRPVIQGHEAYTPKLEALNSVFLTSPKAPDNILFKVETIDDRMPAYEDGPSWPLLLSGYVPYRYENDYLFLRKTAASKEPDHSTPIIAHPKLKVRYELPSSPGLLFARLKIQPTPAGRFLSFIYKPELLYLSLELADGSKRLFRLPSGLAEAGFLLSPLVETTPEFAFLFNDQNYLASKQVKAIEVGPGSRGSPFWQEDYTLELGTLTVMPSSNDLAIATVFDPIARAVGEEIEEVDCEGNIEAMNGHALGAAFSLSGSTLSVTGWTTKDGKAGQVSDAVFVALIDTDKHERLITTRSFPRDDLARFFQRPEVRNSGFKTFADISGMKGQYQLQLVQQNQGHLQACHQLKQVIALNEPVASDTSNQKTMPDFDKKIEVPQDTIRENSACEANIDALDGKPFVPGPASASDRLSIEGWMTLSGAQGSVPEKVFVTLTNADGRSINFQTRKMPRSDINAYFKQPDMKEAGFRANIDLSGLSGHYVLGLARYDHDQLQTCSQFTIPIDIGERQ